MLPKNKSIIRGQILIGILIATGVFAILSHALFTLVSSSFKLVAFNRARITARHLAQEKIEVIRNLPYGSVGTIGGVPQGVVTQEENIVRNGLNFLVKTSVVFIDDPFDNLAPDDAIPSDYKRVRVEVSWEGLSKSRKNPVVLLTDISPQLEGPAEGGTLIVQVFNANGEAVPQAAVAIVASSLNPTINLTQQTGSSGKVTLPGTPGCISCYEITITKTGYSSDRTYSTGEVANPSKPHMSVFDGQVTQISFAIDKVGSLNISSRDSRENNFAPLGNVTFRLRGNKIIGTNILAQPVYKYDESKITSASGNINLSNMEWDIYHVLMPQPTSYDISGTNLLLPLNLPPEGTIDFTFSVSSHSDHSFFVTIKNPSQTQIATASARIYDDQGFEKVDITGNSGNPDFGQVLLSSLAEKTYHLEATASGYLNFNGDFDVSGYTKGEVVLTPQ